MTTITKLSPLYVIEYSIIDHRYHATVADTLDIGQGWTCGEAERQAEVFLAGLDPDPWPTPPTEGGGSDDDERGPQAWVRSLVQPVPFTLDRAFIAEIETAQRYVAAVRRWM